MALIKFCKPKFCGQLVAFMVLMGIALGEVAWARIKLITLPIRERVEIRLEHKAATLVEEERIVPLLQGANQVDFSWANTQVDADSIVFRVLGDEDVRVLSVSYPPGEAALVWNVYAAKASAARVRISYLLSGISKTYNYRALVSHDETTMVLSQYVRVRNEANEAFAQAGLWLRHDQRIERPLNSAQTRELLSARWPQVPVEKTFSVGEAAYGWLNQSQQKLNVALHYLLRNDTDSGLGTAPMPAGKARIFQDDGAGSSAFLGEDWGQRTAVGEQMRLFLGLSRDITVKRKVHQNERKNVEGNLFEQHIVLRYTVENFKEEAVRLQIEERFNSLRRALVKNNTRAPQWSIGSETNFQPIIDTDRTNINALVFYAILPPATDRKAQKTDLDLHLVLKNEW